MKILSNIAWFLLPSLTWYNREKDHQYVLSFWGPNQTWLILFTREEYDGRGQVEWATPLWYTGMYLKRWLYRKKKIIIDFETKERGILVKKHDRNVQEWERLSS